MDADIPARLTAENKKLKEALKFVQELASEEYQYAKAGTGSEVALRHIMRRADEALGIDR